MASILQITWFTYGQYKITDVHGKLYDEVQQFMLEHFRSYGLFQVLKFQQEPDIEEEFLRVVKNILEDESSIIVMDTNLNSIKGVALLKCMTKAWRSWTALDVLLENERFKELFDLVRWCMQRQSLQYKENPPFDTLHIFSFHLCQELQEDKEFLLKFFEAICQVGRHMHMPRVTYLCLSKDDHECMESVGFKETVRVIYSMYVFNNRRPFDRLRDINEMYGIFYEKKLQPILPFQEMLIRHSEAFAIKDKKTKK